MSSDRPDSPQNAERPHHRTERHPPNEDGQELEPQKVAALVARLQAVEEDALRQAVASCSPDARSAQPSCRPRRRPSC